MSSLMNFGQSTHVITRLQRFGLKNKKIKRDPTVTINQNWEWRVGRAYVSTPDIKIEKH